MWSETLIAHVNDKDKMIYKTYELLTCNHPETGELITEEFRPVKDYEGKYEVSSFGRVLSLNYQRFGYPKLLVASADTNGYMRVSLSLYGVDKSKQIHKLVAIAFHDHTPNGFTRVVDHKDCDKKNNKAINLRIVTQRENSNLKHIPHTSKYTGVFWSKAHRRWVASIGTGQKCKKLGYFTNEDEAAKAYEIELLQITSV